MILTKKRKIAVLKRAKELLAAPEGWTKGRYQKKLDDGRVTYCLIGAVNAAAREMFPEEYIDHATTKVVDRVSLTTFVRKKTGKKYVYLYNDAWDTKKQDVLNVLDEYIGVLEA